ncbi:hypothetical protein [Vibrio gallaecicus]|uniref:hypothetical protein n=1 Tax=Vibrio gallaecicus TaxID=552386 RepID=UPI0025B60EEC|nr:hypothetical protein [Vibrio gallaecicus]MDN3616003.1 hypothetical protein [Vibrio gallaecicus]
MAMLNGEGLFPKYKNPILKRISDLNSIEKFQCLIANKGLPCFIYCLCSLLVMNSLTYL